MGSGNFTASLLRASAKGFAGLAATRMFEEHPALVEAAGFDAWQDFLGRQLLALASSVEDEAPERFSAGLVWSRDAFVARAASSEGVDVALRSLQTVLEEALPAEAWGPLPGYFRQAREDLVREHAEGSAIPEGSALEGAGPWKDLAQRYLAALVAGDDQGAWTLLREVLDAGRLSVQDLVTSVLAPVQRELGRRWHHGDLGVGDEHFGTQVTRKVLARALAGARRAPSKKRSVVVAAVSGDGHDLGLLFVAAFFELEGWRTLFLGADTPIDDLVQFVVRHQPDLVALGATLEEQRATTARAIEALHEARPGQRVLVGGAAYEGRADLWRRSGADAHAADPGEAVKTALQLVGA